MAKTVVGLFDDVQEAQAVVEELMAEGFNRDDISIVAKSVSDTEMTGGTSSGMRDNDADDTASGAASGAGTGALLGGAAGLLLGLGSLAIPGVGPILGAGPVAAALAGAGIGAAAGGLIGALTNAGVPEEEAGYYTEGVRRGHTLITVTADDAMADAAADIMERHNVVDIDERVSEWRQGGWSGTDATPSTLASSSMDSGTRPDIAGNVSETRTSNINADQTANMNTANMNTANRNPNEGRSIPVVEEELRVGKREVERGGVRVRSYVTERPVEESVSLREEQVHVERRPVNQPLSEREAAPLFREESIELTERGEEAVVSKQARVIEEVFINKDVTEHTEMIQDTVRRTDVDVEELGANRTFATRNLDDYQTNYRSTFADRGYSFEQYAPAYRFGETLAQDTRYNGRDWNSVELEARNHWEQRNSGTWEEFKDAVHYAWDRARNSMR